MSDIRKTVTSLFFRAQLGQPQRQVRQPQRLVYAGPGEPGEGGVATAAGVAAGQAAAMRRPQRLDPVGVATAARAEPGAEVAHLRTNRGEAGPQRPVTVPDEPGRNDPCPCGSGKKYKKCHGAAG
jgi:preprotein translocase subunit SecA